MQQHQSASVRPRTAPAARATVRATETGDDDYVADLGKCAANILVSVRVRPENDKETDTRTVVRVLNSNVVVFDPADGMNKATRRGMPSHVRRAKEERYAFDRVFDETASNEEVYQNTTKHLLDGVLQGFNATVFAYGATGAGKTFTMLGNQSGGGGVMTHTMRDLFKLIESQRVESKVTLRMSYLEIYNETIRDLLVENSGPLDMREDPVKGITIAGLTSSNPTSADEVMEMLHLGNSRRTQSATEANATSSRSHAVFQITVERVDRNSGVQADVQVSKLSLIDLAGSERAASTQNRGVRLLEGANINRSLLALGNCINALASGRKGSFVNYRDSKLTRLLKDSLGGNCRTVMISCLGPSALSYEDTHNTLKYANRAKNIKTRVVRNVLNVNYHISKYNQIIEELRAENTELRERLNQRQTADVLSDGISAEDTTVIEWLKCEIASNFDERTQIAESIADTEERIFNTHDLLQQKSKSLALCEARAREEPLLWRLRKEVADLERSLGALRSQLKENEQRLERAEESALKLQRDSQSKLRSHAAQVQLENELARHALKLKTFEAQKKEEFCIMQVQAKNDQLALVEEEALERSDLARAMFALLKEHDIATSEIERRFQTAFVVSALEERERVAAIMQSPATIGGRGRTISSSTWRSARRGLAASTGSASAFYKAGSNGELPIETPERAIATRGHRSSLGSGTPSNNIIAKLFEDATPGHERSGTVSQSPAAVVSAPVASTAAAASARAAALQVPSLRLNLAALTSPKPEAAAPVAIAPSARQKVPRLALGAAAAATAAPEPVAPTRQKVPRLALSAAAAAPEQVERRRPMSARDPPTPSAAAVASSMTVAPAAAAPEMARRSVLQRVFSSAAMPSLVPTSGPTAASAAAAAAAAAAASSTAATARAVPHARIDLSHVMRDIENVNKQLASGIGRRHSSIVTDRPATAHPSSGNNGSQTARDRPKSAARYLKATASSSNKENGTTTGAAVPPPGSATKSVAAPLTTSIASVPLASVASTTAPVASVGRLARPTASSLARTQSRSGEPML